MQVVWEHSFPVFPLCQGEEKIQLSDHYNMFERSGMHFLEIRHVCSEDAGVYTCLVANSAGKASATAELTVQGNRERWIDGETDYGWILDQASLGTI